MYNVIIAPKYEEVLMALSQLSGRKPENILTSLIEKHLAQVEDTANDALSNTIYKTFCYNCYRTGDALSNHKCVFCGENLNTK